MSTKFTIKPFIKAAPASEYAEAIAALAEAGDGVALDLVVPTADTAKVRRAFGTAAREAGFGAKTEAVAENKEDKGATSTVTFTLGALRTRTAKPAEATDTVEVSE